MDKLQNYISILCSIITPVQKELCMLCKRFLESTESYICDNVNCMLALLSKYHKC